MHFDDRLATVLRHPTTSRAMSRIQFRQLIDLLGNAPVADHASAVTEAALARIDELASAIPAAERAAVLREPMVRLANPDLIARLVSAESDVASAAIAAADLAEAAWLDLIPSLPIRARGILRHRRDMSPRIEALLERLGIGDRGLPSSDAEAPAESDAPGRPQRPELVVVDGGASVTPLRPLREEPSAAGIGAIVRRIEAFRKARATDDERDARQLQLAGIASEPAAAAILSVDFTTDTAGRVDWADGSVAPSLVGLHLASSALSGAAEQLRSATRHRQPLRNVAIVLDGAADLAGTWRLDALPRFGAPDGRFLGYAARLRRSMQGPAGSNDAIANAADSMREVLHELRTPANAIQVAAEIIQQQLYGPAPHEYRALAAAIAGDTAQILAGFEELDRLVRLESGAVTLDAGECDLSSLVQDTVARLRSWTTPRGGMFHVDDSLGTYAVALEREDAARLVWRLFAALAGAMGTGESIGLALGASDRGVVVTIDLPEALADRIDKSQGTSAVNEHARSLSSGIFGVAFTLRLAAAEAAAAGGALVREALGFKLILPGLTPAAAGHTHA